MLTRFSGSLHMEADRFPPPGSVQHPLPSIGWGDCEPCPRSASGFPVPPFGTELPALLSNEPCRWTHWRRVGSAFPVIGALETSLGKYLYWNDLLQIHSLINENDRGTDRQGNIFFLILILKQQTEFRINFPSFFFWLWTCLCSVIGLTLSFLWLCLYFFPPDLAVRVFSFLLSALWSPPLESVSYSDITYIRLDRNTVFIDLLCVFFFNASFPVSKTTL